MTFLLFFSAAEQFHEVRNGLVDVLDDLAMHLQGTQAMAGGYPAGRRIGDLYDKCAPELVRDIALITHASAAAHEMLTTFSLHRLREESGCTIKEDEEPAIPQWVLLDICSPKLPSAGIGIQDEPHWWHYINPRRKEFSYPMSDISRLPQAEKGWENAVQQID